MAFTRRELARGALSTWLSFLSLLSLAFLIPAVVLLFAPGSTGGISGSDVGADWSVRIGGFVVWLCYLIPALIVGGAVSALVTLAAAPLAGLIGRSLVRVRTRWIHACAYFALGGVVGALVGLVGNAWALGPSHMSGDATILLVIAAGATGASATAGWTITARRALRDDAAVAELWPDRA
ncbi:conserved membrane hypothetical protein [Microbacterium sp. 8M]|uniref:hypothetical protein n=1 Tax=Microbacterium sp. 8M TaxID=2653153 RepID=UPI0012F3B1F5|nr:hypothetical protein [Microbacterium sp. 8M]VXC17355.1 conserved membrane hypothetical protein [Microbacterium sp. 8M]